MHALHYTASWVDDSYITLRYARHLRIGEGLVFNPGEHVEGLTNLGWALFLAPFTGGDPLRVAKVVGLACALTAVFVVVRALDDWRDQLAVTALLAGVPFLPYWAVQGMETPVVALLVTLAWLAYPRERAGGLPIASVAMALAPWIRPDAAVVPLLVIGWHFATGGNRRQALRGGAIVLASAVALVATKLALFGSILPNTFHAKVEGGGWIKGVMYLLNFGWEWGLGVLLIGAMLWRIRSLPALVAAAYVAMCVAVGGDIFDNYRLLMPALPALAWCLVSIGGRARWPVLAACLALSFALAPTARVRDLARHDRLPMPSTIRVAKTTFGPKALDWGWDDNAHGAWPTAWSVVNAPEDARVSFTELGLFAYTQDNRVVDPLGLTTPALVGMHDPLDRFAWMSDRIDVLLVDITAGFFQKSKPAMQLAGWQPVDGCDSWWVFTKEPLASPRDRAARIDTAWERVPHMSTFHALLVEEARLAGEDVTSWQARLEGSRGVHAPVDCPGRLDPLNPPSDIWPRPKVALEGIDAPTPEDAIDCEDLVARARRAWQSAMVGQTTDEALAAGQAVIDAADSRAMKNASLLAVVAVDGELAGGAHQEVLRAFEVCAPDRKIRPDRPR